MNTLSGKEEREAIWGCFHKLRCFEPFRDAWNTFVQQAIQTKPSAIFYQRVTEQLFNKLIEVKFHYAEQSKPSTANSDTNTITHIEENVLRYVSGYICRTVAEK